MNNVPLNSSEINPESDRDDWILTLNMDAIAAPVMGEAGWAHRGPYSGFLAGVLFDRDLLVDRLVGGAYEGTDADLIVQAYEQEGMAALKRLRGSYVVAVIDLTRSFAVVARDHVGSHPLFYAERGGNVLFATSPHRLLALPGISRELNRAAMADHLCNRWPDWHETFFTAVRRVPPGWWAVLSNGKLTLEKYWNPIPQDRPAEWLTAEDVKQFGVIFDRAVDRCLRTGPTGIFLSGGLDSIGVAAVAADRAGQIGQTPPLALSLAFPDPECDERIAQASVAGTLGLRQHLIEFHEALGFRPLFEQSIELTKELPAPTLNPWQPAYLPLARLAEREGVKTIMTGHGGDEWLTVTPYLAADLIRRGAFIELARFYNTLRRSHRLTPLALARSTFWRFGLRPLCALALTRLLPEAHRKSRLRRLLGSDPSWVSPAADLRAQQQERAVGALIPPDPAGGFYLRELWMGIEHTLMSWESEERYNIGSRMGIRFLNPFCDPDVVELLWRVPPRILNQGGYTKGLLRQTLARRFPALGLERQRKVLANNFFNTLLLREGPALAKVAGDFPVLSSLGVVDGRSAADFVKDELARPSRSLHRVWSLVNLELWARAQL